MILAVKDIEKSFADSIILDNVNIAVNEGDRIGLVGANGTGKTTLLNILCKRLQSDKGEVSYKSNITIGYLQQDSGLEADNSIIDEMNRVFEKLLAIQKELRDLEAQLALTSPSDAEYKELSEKYSQLSAFFEQNDGYNIDVKIKSVLNGMGFLNKDLSTNISTLSGGEKTRLALAKILLEEPDLLVLDEPTNHLDFKTLMWLEEYLSSYKGGLIIVSHDRYFLDKTVNIIWEIESANISVFKGNYTKYKQLKAEQVSYQQKLYEQNEQKVAQMMDYAQKNIARASTSNSAKSRLKQLANMEVVKKPLPQIKPPSFSFVYDREPVKDVLSVNELNLTVGEENISLIKDISFDVKRSEKIAIIGDNGTGKSTLLKRLIKAFSEYDINVKWGKNVSVSYYDQENKNLNFNNTLLEELHSRFPTHTEQEMRSMLGRVRLTDDNVYKKVSMVSGGERARLSLALVMLMRANTVVMDEPTNHLDLQSKEKLEEALVSFDGTLIFVSHDRYFLNTVPTGIIELTENGVNYYNGGFDFYLAQKAKTVVETQSVKIKEEGKSKDSFYKSKAQRSEEAKIRNRIKQLEREMAECEQTVKQLEEDISNPQNASDYGLLNELCSNLDEKKLYYDELMMEWLELTE